MGKIDFKAQPRYWKQFDDSTWEPSRSIETAVDPVIMQTLLNLPLFEQFYDENLSPEEFVKLQPSRDTLNQFLNARDELLKIVRARMV